MLTNICNEKKNYMQCMLNAFKNANCLYFQITKTFYPLFFSKLDNLSTKLFYKKILNLLNFFFKFFKLQNFEKRYFNKNIKYDVIKSFSCKISKYFYFKEKTFKFFIDYLLY